MLRPFVRRRGGTLPFAPSLDGRWVPNRANPADPPPGWFGRLLPYEDLAFRLCRE